MTLLRREKHAGGKASIDERLTVILTLKDRVAFTKRWLDYADGVRFPFRILIADGGQDEQVSQHLAQRAYSHLAIEYLRFSADARYVDYYAKLRAAAELVSTPYCILADNDDFYCADGIRQCMDFLDGHADFSACLGEWVGFRVSTEGNLVSANAVLFGKAYRPFCDFAQTDPCDRFDAVARTNVQTMYAVTRNGVYRDAFAFLEQIAVGDLFLFEAFLEFALLARGKVKTLRVPYYFRQITTTGTSNDEQTKRGQLPERVLFSSFSSDLAKIKEWLVDAHPQAATHRDVIEQRTRQALQAFVLSAVAGYFRTPRRLGALRKRWADRARTWITRSSTAAALVSRIYSGDRGDGDTRRQYEHQMQRIATFLREGRIENGRVDGN